MTIPSNAPFPSVKPLEPTSGAGLQLIGMTGPMTSLLIANQASQSEALSLVIARDMEEAYRLEGELRFFLKGQDNPPEILSLPDRETLPYDLFSPHQEITSQRIHALAQLAQARHAILIVPVSTMLHRLPPAGWLKSVTTILKTGQRIVSTDYARDLEMAGYTHVDTVYEHGEFAVRGSIIDIFPMGSEVPVRIDLFDDEVESLRVFDPETQRTLNKTNQFTLLPANEFPFDNEARKQFISRLFEQFPECPKDSPLYRDVKSGIKPGGIEYYLPLFFDHTSLLFDYLPRSTTIYQMPSVYEAAQHFWQDVRSRYEDRRHDLLRPILPPDALFCPTEDFFQAAGTYPRIRLGSSSEKGRPVPGFSGQPVPDVSVNHQLARPLIRLEQFMEQFDGAILICAETTGRKELLTDLLRKYGMPWEETESWHEFVTTARAGSKTQQASLYITTWPLDASALIPEANIALLSENALFGQKVLQSRRRKKATDSGESVVRNLAELTVGAPVVHLDHGVGRYQGLEVLDIDGQPVEFLALSYANDTKLYVPVTSLHLISRYTGMDPDLAPLHKLGSDKWTTAKKKALEKIRDTAAELLEIYAKRNARKGFQFDPPDAAYQIFCDQFPFEETADQLEAIRAIERDMASPKPMDRLICGDVGFGKTEVAMRAAFLATHSGKQVAVLTPTTLLAQQHFESFSDRFSGTAIKVEVLSRFKTGAETSQILKSLEEGKIDIIIGTHKLLQKDVRFKNLGLLIIDEEHRFGVQQKEKIKSLRAEVDILTLTATPIPRTLNMAMGGIRDLSIIATPPARRLSVKTFVHQKENTLIKEAILREILRGGQVFYLHNEVKTIDKTASELAELVPEARITVAHGQMRERELEHIMSDFYHKKFNVLVCTTIIETGIDIPSANTIIIDRADKLGVAQLHQLRGRVGRSHHQAYAYLLTPHQKSLSKDAEKRLEAIAATQDLGAGFTLATHDMEIRGAGELLGEEQSGQIQSIGFTLYMELLDQAVKSIQEGKEISLEQESSGAEINLRIPAIIPEDYLPDVHARLILYKRIANAPTDEALNELRSEVIDRYGLLPEPLKNLFRQTSLKLFCQKIGVRKIDAGPTSGIIEFDEKPSVDPMKIIELVQKQFEKFTLKGSTTLSFRMDSANADDKLREISDLLYYLAGKNETL